MAAGELVGWASRIEPLGGRRDDHFAGHLSMAKEHLASSNRCSGPDGLLAYIACALGRTYADAHGDYRSERDFFAAHSYRGGAGGLPPGSWGADPLRKHPRKICAYPRWIAGVAWVDRAIGNWMALSNDGK